MFEFTDAERAYLTEMRALTTDGQGREVLAGLTFDETVFYIERGRRFVQGIRDRDSRDRFLELHEKHERVRFAVLHGEHELQHDKPTRQ